VPYFHVVFTLPAPIAHIAYQNKTVIYDLLFNPLALVYQCRQLVLSPTRSSNSDLTHRTGQADFPHPALGQDFTPSPTARRAQAGTGVRAQSADELLLGRRSRLWHQEPHD
jgi:hypothetical protein